MLKINKWKHQKSLSLINNLSELHLTLRQKTRGGIEQYLTNPGQPFEGCRCLWASSAWLSKRRLTFPKSLTSNRSNASNSSLFFMPNTSLHAARKVLMFFRHRNCERNRGLIKGWVDTLLRERVTRTNTSGVLSIIYLFRAAQTESWYSMTPTMQRITQLSNQAPWGTWQAAERDIAWLASYPIVTSYVELACRHKIKTIQPHCKCH